MALGSPLRSALKELSKLLPNLRPMQIPLRPSEVPVFVLYADAYIHCQAQFAPQTVGSEKGFRAQS